ncbi:MAG: M28 family peptidase [Anaerolineales bacterium]|uniref:M28 family peptidase n=1 Tax=Candidatus Desulfolinea nitratireducens TaxID=2841698 RepID=A0A8J6NPM0_9CHLR|nr:M28 family peptidase [Candidatus Desulfolinea nitratireducens]MBL6961593.1 M28 family peptidase [Anaerolineales bacterium]
MMKRRPWFFLLLSISFMVVGAYLLWTELPLRTRPELAPAKFDGERAYQDIIRQTELGPRTPDSEAHAQVRIWMRTELEEAGWDVEVHNFESLGHQGYNLIASRGTSSPQIIFGAHYDSRIHADQDLDPHKRGQAVLGANDGASGVAALLELARNIPQDSLPIWLVFFDLEDNGNLPGWDWILGSRAFLQEYAPNPDAVIILDMIGDADLNIYLERNSTPKIREEIWSQASMQGFEAYFIANEKYSILDDHTPFLEAGIPAVDIIDFDYPYWHTTEDTLDKVSADSLQIVGDTILSWLEWKNKE